MARLRICADRLLDGTGNAAIEGGVAVLVEDDRIAAVGPEAAVPAPEDARRRSFPGATVLPGLIDQHVHLCVARGPTMVDDTRARTDEELLVWGVGSAERMLRAGVTTVFDCGGRGRSGLRIRDAVAAGLGLGPRVLASGRPITATGGHCWFWGEESDGEAAIRVSVARLLDEEGAHGIRIMATGGYSTPTTDRRLSAYPVEVLAAAAEEAHKRGRYITAHAHGVDGMRAASEAGIDCLQHASMIGDGRAWAFDEALTREMAARGTRAAMTMMQSVRLQRESGVLVDWRTAKRGDALGAAMWMADARGLLDAGVTLVTDNGDRDVPHGRAARGHVRGCPEPTHRGPHWVASAGAVGRPARGGRCPGPGHPCPAPAAARGPARDADRAHAPGRPDAAPRAARSPTRRTILTDRPRVRPAQGWRGVRPRSRTDTPGGPPR